MPADPGSPSPAVASQESGLAKGATIGRYVVLGLLGRGGMGEVFAAYDPELDRKIAVKLLRVRAGASDADGRTRLLREAQAIARLSHPNVVVVYDVGTFRDSVFIAMEFVDGNTVGYWIEAQQRTWREVLDVYAAAGRGLVAAHAAGLVHRDFKPENVMLTRSGQVRVMDFGLAREQLAPGQEPPAGEMASDLAGRAAALAETFGDEGDTDATAKLGGGPGAVPSSTSGGYLKLKLTQTGAMLGTPAYMAPEQFAGTGGDARTDQFSFCVALYEGMYRVRPFAGNTPVELMANVLAGTVTDAPSDARVPAWIRKILLRGLSTTPGDRFASMTELLAALAQDPAARRRRWLGAATGLAMLTVAAAGVHRFAAGQHAVCAGGADRAATAWGRDRRAAVERAFKATGSKNAGRALAGVSSLVDQYVTRWADMYKETCEATHVRGEQSAEVLDLRMECLGERLSSVRALGDVFASANPAVVDNAVGAASALPALDRCADVEMLRAVVKPPDNAAVRARVAAARDQIAKVKALGDSGQCPQASAGGRAVVADAVAIGYLPLKAEARLALGRLGENCIDPAESVQVLEDAVMDAEAAHHDAVDVEASIFLAEWYSDRVIDRRMSSHYVRHAQAVLSRFSGHPLWEAWIAVARAASLDVDGRYEDALKEEQRALALKDQALGRANVDTADSLMNVAIRFQEVGRSAEAADYGNRAVELLSSLLGPHNVRVALALANEAEYLTALQKFGPAQQAIDRALAVWRDNNASPFFVGVGMLYLGRLQLAEGNQATAETTLQKATEMLKGTPVQEAQAQFALGRAVWAGPGRRARAVELVRHARAALVREAGSQRDVDEIDRWLATRG